MPQGVAGDALGEVRLGHGGLELAAVSHGAGCQAVEEHLHRQQDQQHAGELLDRAQGARAEPAFDPGRG